MTPRKSSQGYQHRILRILPSEAFVFSTKERSPYLITFEVERTYKDMDGDASLHGYDKLSKIKLRKRKQQEPEAEPQNANYPENQFTYTTTIESLGDVNHHGGGVEVQETGEGAIPGDEDQTELNTDAVQVDPEIMEAFGEPWSEKEERYSFCETYYAPTVAVQCARKDMHVQKTEREELINLTPSLLLYCNFTSCALVSPEYESLQSLEIYRTGRLPLVLSSPVINSDRRCLQCG